VIIFEAAPVIGGKAACEPHNEHLLRDHSIKNFSSYYYCFLETMKRIPYDVELDDLPFVTGGKTELDAAITRFREQRAEGRKEEDRNPQQQQQQQPEKDVTKEGESGGKREAEVELEEVPLGDGDKDRGKGKKKEEPVAPKKKAEEVKAKPKKAAKVVFDNLHPLPKLHCILPDGTLFKINTSLNLSLLAKYREFTEFRMVLRKQGLGSGKVDSFVKKHARLLWVCDQRKLAELNSITYEEYLGFNQREHPEVGMLLSLVEIISAAKVDGSALAASDQALKLFGRFFNPHSMKNTGNLLTGMISKKMLHPWARQLQNLGVEIYLKRPLAQILVDETDKGKITGFQLQDGEIVKGDYYVCALPYSRLKFLVNNSGITDRFKQVPYLESESGEKWGHTCHFALKALPEGAEATVVCAVLNSRWSCIYYYVTDALWQNQGYPSKEAPVQLWITCSDAMSPGEVHKKPYPMCTEDEFKEELLHQIKFKDSDKGLIVDSVPGRGLGWWKESTQTMMPGLSPLVDQASAVDEFNQGPPVHGERVVQHEDPDIKFVCETPLYAREIGSPEFTINTDFKNLFLAGECVQTRQMISTMEKANEGGKRCAHAVCEATGKSYPTKKFEYHPLPFRGLRFMDAFFWHLCCHSY